MRRTAFALGTLAAVLALLLLIRVFGGAQNDGGHAPSRKSTKPRVAARTEATNRASRSSPKAKRHNLRGRVVDEEDQGLPDASVMVSARTLHCDPLGRFSLPIAESPVPLQLIVAAPGYVTQRILATVLPGAHSEAARQTELTIRLEHGQLIRGRCLTMKGHPLAGVRVSLEPYHEPHARSDAYGHWELACLPRDRRPIILAAEKAGYARSSKSLRTRSLAEQIELRLAPASQIAGRAEDRSAAADTSQALQPSSKSGKGGSLRGRVLDAQSKRSIPDVRIRVYRLAPRTQISQAVLQTYSDRDGRFQLEGLPLGRIRLVAYRADYGSTILEPLSTEREGTLQRDILFPTSATLHGRVLDAQGKGIAGIALRLRMLRDASDPANSAAGANSAAWKSRSDAQGRFKFTQGLGPGSYRIASYGTALPTVAAAGWPQEQLVLDREVELAASEVRALRLQAEGQCRLEVDVPALRSQSSCRLRLERRPTPQQPGRIHAPYQTFLQQGRAVLGALVAGKYQLRIDAGKAGQASTEFELSAHERRRILLELQASKQH